MAVYLSARRAGELGDIDKANRNLGLKKPFSAVPMQRLLVQIVDRYCKRPDFLDTELTWHREREGLTHTVVIHKHLFDKRGLTFSPPRFKVSFFRPVITNVSSSVR
jgi:hypothetical protein